MLDKYIIEGYLFERNCSVKEREIIEETGLGDVNQYLSELVDDLKERGVNVVYSGGGWCLRSNSNASDLAKKIVEAENKLTKSAMEVLSVIVAFSETDPVTRSDIEKIRGVQLSPTVFESLFSLGLIKPGKRRETNGRPLTWVVSSRFFEVFDVDSMSDLKSLQKMKDDKLLVLPSAGVVQMDKVLDVESKSPEECDLNL